MLTKSDFLNFLECPAYLWLSKHRRDLLPSKTLAVEEILKMGQGVDNLARQLFPGGTEVSGYNEDGYKNTVQAMDSRVGVLFQATAVARGILSARADILTRNAKIGGWDMHEVKMGTSVKPANIYDVAFQRICFEEAGIPIGRTYLVHVNNKFIRHGKIRVDKFFVSEDVTETVLEKLEETKELIKMALNTAELKSAPDLRILVGCENPKTCDYIKVYCDAFPRTHDAAKKLDTKKLLEYLNLKILDWRKIPKELVKKIGFHEEKPFKKVDKLLARKEFKKLKYPLYFFDYETYGSAIPPFDGYRPYQAIPFQYSLLVREKPGEPVRSMEFLARESIDPVPALLASLKKNLGVKGSIIVWNASFETGRNEEMAKMYPKYSAFLKNLNKRIFDLMLIFKFQRGIYTNSEFEKSASLKKVLPVICPELSYSSLEIQEGGEASASWPILTSEKVSLEEKEKLFQNMLKYCKRDTEAMVCILDKVLKEIQ